MAANLFDLTTQWRSPRRSARQCAGSRDPASDPFDDVAHVHCPPALYCVDRFCEHKEFCDETTGDPGVPMRAAHSARRRAGADRDHSQHDGDGFLRRGHGQFETSCAPAVKAPFNHAVAELHSFWFPEARAGFEAVLKTDPACAIAYWGIALTHWGNPFAGLRSPQAIAAGKAAIERASPPDRRPRARRATSTPSPDCSRAPIRVRNAPACWPTRRRPRRWRLKTRTTSKRASSGRSRLRRPRCRPTSRSRRTCGRRRSSSRSTRRCRIIQGWRTTSSTPTTCRRWRTRRCPPRAPTRRSRRRCRMRSTCRRIPSRASALWKESVATNIKSAAEAEKTGGVGEALHALDYQTTRICRWRRTRRPRRCSTMP